MQYQKVRKFFRLLIFVGTICQYFLLFFAMEGTETEGLYVILLAPIYVLLDVIGYQKFRHSQYIGHTLLLLNNTVKVFLLVTPGLNGLVTGSAYENTPWLFAGYFFMFILISAIAIDALLLSREKLENPSEPAEKDKLVRFPLPLILAFLCVIPLVMGNWIIFAVVATITVVFSTYNNRRKTSSHQQ